MACWDTGVPVNKQQEDVSLLPRDGLDPDLGPQEAFCSPRPAAPDGTWGLAKLQLCLLQFQVLQRGLQCLPLLLARPNVLLQLRRGLLLCQQPARDILLGAQREDSAHRAQGVSTMEQEGLQGAREKSPSMKPWAEQSQLPMAGCFLGGIFPHPEAGALHRSFGLLHLCCHLGLMLDLGLGGLQLGAWAEERSREGRRPPPPRPL